MALPGSGCSTRPDSAAARVSQTGVISNNTVTRGAEGGLVSFAYARNSVNAVVSQTFLVTANHFTDDLDGVFISASAIGTQGKINGSWTLAGNTITHSL